MKNKILVVIMFLVFPPFVIAQSYFPVGKQDAKTTYSSKTNCEAKEGQDCFDVSEKDKRYHEVKSVEIDDTDKPIFKSSYKTQACDDVDKCNALMGTADPCDEGDGYFIRENNLLPGYSIYCTRLLGYEKILTKQLVENPTLKAEVEAADQVLQAKQNAKILIAKNIAFGQDLKAEISLINLSRGFTTTQVQQFVDTFESVNRLLDAGAVKTAQSVIQGLTPDDSLLRQEDKDSVLALIEAYLTKNPQ